MGKAVGPSARRGQLLEAGLFLILVAAPLVVAPFARASFADPKFVVVTLGAVLIAAGRPDVDRRLAQGSLGWFVALVIVSIAGNDLWWSLTGSEVQNTGVVTLAVAGFLLCTAPAIGEELRRRLPGWIFWTTVVVAAVAVTGRFVPFGGTTWELGPLAATMGHRVYVGALMAVGAMAAIALKKDWRHYAGLVVIGSGLAVSAVRSAWVGAAVGAIVIVLLDRRLARAVATTFVIVAIVLGAWTVANNRLPESGIEYSAAQRFTELDEGSAAQRPPVFRAYVSGFFDDPLFGSGPATGWSVFLTHVDPTEITESGRGYADAHNIVAELAATTGVIGLLPLLAIAVLAAIRLRGAPSDRRWALGASIALGIFHMLQPLNVVLTPLLFLLVGLSLRSPPDADRRRTPRWLVVIVAVGLVLASARFIAATFDRYAYEYASERSYRWALRVEPRNLATRIRFAKYLALDARSGDRQAGIEARWIVNDAIAAHRWHPEVRLSGADVLTFMGDVRGAYGLVGEHLAQFPNDPRALLAGMNLALRLDLEEDAIDRAHDLLAIDAANAAARKVVRDRGSP